MVEVGTRHSHQIQLKQMEAWMERTEVVLNEMPYLQVEEVSLKRKDGRDRVIFIMGIPLSVTWCFVLEVSPACRCCYKEISLITKDSTACWPPELYRTLVQWLLRNGYWWTGPHFTNNFQSTKLSQIEYHDICCFLKLENILMYEADHS